MLDTKRKPKIDYSLSFEDDNDEVEFLSEEKKELQDQFKKKYLTKNSNGEDSNLTKALKEITLSQMNRFYSLIENSNFSFKDKDIENFVEKQLERATNSKEGSELKKSEKFYTYYKNNFLKLDEKEMKVTFEIMKDLVRYYEGVKKIENIDGIILKNLDKKKGDK
ncbi:hypothetical protein [Fusobacterium polymorphum]|uniref:hypothetical protein n=1 Tax=Fusobacterium nucleatum subsp. polymorphum TaxID=76857 RepID=UPI003008C2E5